NARLQLMNSRKYSGCLAKALATHSSERSRSALKYAGPFASRSSSAHRSSSSHARDLYHWWFTARPSTTRLGDEADRSLLMTTEDRRWAIAATRARLERIAVTGTCPSSQPEALDERILSSRRLRQRTIGSPVLDAGRSIAANRSEPFDSTKSASSASTASSVTVTIESIPPPKGTSGPRSLAGSSTRRTGRPPLIATSRRSSWLRYANSPRQPCSAA